MRFSAGVDVVEDLPMRELRLGRVDDRLDPPLGKAVLQAIAEHHGADFAPPRAPAAPRNYARRK